MKSGHIDPDHVRRNNVRVGNDNSITVIITGIVTVISDVTDGACTVGNVSPLERDTRVRAWYRESIFSPFLSNSSIRDESVRSSLSSFVFPKRVLKKMHTR